VARSGRKRSCTAQLAAGPAVVLDRPVPGCVGSLLGSVDMRSKDGTGFDVCVADYSLLMVKRCVLLLVGGGLITPF
jgi:hypothetical protein